MSLGGYGTKRGNPILSIDTKNSDVDNIPYTTLLYTNGPGYANDRNPTVGKDAIQTAAVPRNWATHGGEDVPVFTIGPLSNLFSGLFDQTYIPHAIAYVTCTGPFHDRCGCPNSNCDKKNKTCENGSCDDDSDNYVMVSDQDVIADYMKMINGANKIRCMTLVYIFVSSIYLLF